MSESAKTLYLPDTLLNWPWPRRINEKYGEVSAESSAWCRSFKAFNQRSQEAFDRCDFEHLRTGCDLMNLFFVIDEYTDVESASAVQQFVDVIVDALNNPKKPRPSGEVLLGEMTRQFWSLAMKSASLTAQKHFVIAFTDYLESVVDQAKKRNDTYLCTVEEYLRNRRHNIGARPCYAVAEFNLNLPDEVLHNKTIKQLEYLATDIIILGNDILSYNKEQAIGDDRHNIVTIVMHQLGLNIDSAVAWAVRYQTDLQEKFLQQWRNVPCFEPGLNNDVSEYIFHLANWPRASDTWSFESARYFGSKGLDVQKCRYVLLLPKVERDLDLKKDQIIVPYIE
ncbi:hypothetical protein OIDMADRAFT_107833 [Oidiodendron maius Zn]|uniref:Terpene synthase n=1 Tax=Oidiodendron maius (strain Zn) TaxID=913774 RepID=A0A0C3D697_OIDMZ|nr:hypothetical protein OIDMADRAFT_107833 [Oidiodendron maius Zn]